MTRQPLVQVVKPCHIKPVQCHTLCLHCLEIGRKDNQNLLIFVSSQSKWLLCRSRLNRKLLPYCSRPYRIFSVQASTYYAINSFRVSTVLLTFEFPKWTCVIDFTTYSMRGSDAFSTYRLCLHHLSDSRTCSYLRDNHRLFNPSN